MNNNLVIYDCTGVLTRLVFFVILFHSMVRDVEILIGALC
jgi:hypothetical protein